MELIRGIHNLRARHHGCVLTIGNFDGVHLGHQKVVRQVVEKAKKLALPSVVMVFEPQPQELFSGDKAPARLSLLREKFIELAKLGVDSLLVVTFTPEFAQMSADDFIHRLLMEQLGVKFLVVGDDFRFGRQRHGDFNYLQAHAKALDFEVVSTQSFVLCEQRVSSTLIRQALAQGNQLSAKKMLGRPYSISGRVSHGRKLGRTIQFPTANISLKRNVSPVSGVYAVKVGGIVPNQWFDGVANIGMRPTVNGKKAQLEVHLFDFAQDLYGQHLQVQLLHRLRDEKKFASLATLQVQIEQDAQAARKWLSHFNNINLDTE